MTLLDTLAQTLFNFRMALALFIFFAGLAFYGLSVTLMLLIWSARNV